jgi:hypothetical protein
VLARAQDLLDGALAHFLPGAIDPDENAVRDRAALDGDGAGTATLDELLAPLALLVARLVLADDGWRRRARRRVLPADLDRTGAPLEARATFLGRCLRLLGSVHHPRLKDAVGEMLYALCDEDGASPLPPSRGGCCCCCYFADAAVVAAVLQPARSRRRSGTATSPASCTTRA